MNRHFLGRLRISVLNLLLISVLAFSGLLFVLALNSLVSDLHRVQVSWDGYVTDKSDRMQLVTELRRHLGYGAFIHNLKNYLLRQEAFRVPQLERDIGAINASLDRLEIYARSQTERRVLQVARKTISQYERAVDLSQALIEEGRLSVVEIDRRVSVDDHGMLEALNYITHIASLDQSEQITKSRLLNDIRKSIGYGGMIHHFKNLVLRGDLKLVREFRQSTSHLQATIGAYRDMDINSNERQALGHIAGVAAEYIEKLDTVMRSIDQGLSPRAIDRQVVVDDRPALEAFSVLERHVVEDAYNSARNIHELLINLGDLYHYAVIVSVLVLLLLTSSSFWFTRCFLVNPIRNVASTMVTLAHGQADTPIKKMPSVREINELSDSLVFFKDAVSRREAHRVEVEDREARVSAIVNTVLDGIITIDRRGTIETFNPAAETIFGYSSEEVTGHNVNILMPEPYHSEHDGYIEGFLQTGDARVAGIGREVEGRRKDGTIFPMELGISEMKIHGEVMFTGVVRDITERKENERLKSEFVSTVSHELRTPLTSIAGSLSLLLARTGDCLPDKMYNLLEVAQRNTSRLGLLVNDILDMEKLSSGKMIFDFKKLNLIELVIRSIEDNRDFARQHQVELVFGGAMDTATVYGDENRLIQVMTNLISNAVKYSTSGDTVNIDVQARNGQYRVTVTDAGSGIPESFRERMFQRFAQADSSDARGKGGTGLGLHISRSIIECHQGHIDYRSVVGSGTQFYFDLPGYDQAVAELHESA